jgi:hypothetical protein
MRFGVFLLKKQKKIAKTIRFSVFLLKKQKK